MKSTWGFCAFVIAAGVLSVATPSALGGTIVVRPTADLTLFAGGRPEPGQSFLVVGGNRAGRAYLRWQLPAGATVERARLELYTPTGGRGLRVHAGRAQWSEKALPPRNPQGHRLVGALAKASARSWLKLDVTRFARGGGSVSFVVSKTGGEARLVSREGAAAFRPRLLLVLNAAPLCQGGDWAGAEDTQLTGRLACTDDGALRYRKAGDPAHGRVEVAANGEFTYTPAANFHGTDTFALEACEAAPPGRCAGARLQLRIAPVNDAPAAGDLSITTAEEAAAAFGLAGSDADGDALTYSLASQPAHGSATLSGSGAGYQPAANFNGADSFVYVVSDGHGGTAGATVSVNVTAVNDTPAALGQTATTAEDTPKALSLGATDVDGDPLVYEIVSGPTRGTLTGLGNARTYTPAANLNGADSFTFRVSDGSEKSNVATVSLTVTAVNDAPAAIGQAVTTAEDVAKGLSLGAIDVDGDALSYEIVSGPAHGVLSGIGNARTYAPAADYNGPDSLTFRVNDGAASSNVATVGLTITAVNDAPTAVGDAKSTPEDVPLTFSASDLIGNDSAGPGDESDQALAVTGVGGPVGGTVTLVGGNVTFAPQTNFSGAAGFTYTVSDDGRTNGLVDAGSATGTVTVTVDPVNDLPVAENDHYVAEANTTLDVASAQGVLANDTDVEASSLTAVQASSPAHGTVTLSADGSFSYQPPAGFNGRAAFTYRADDGSASSEPARVTVDVGDFTNTPPVAQNLTAAVSEDAAHSLTLSASDADGDELVYSIVTPPEHGLLAGTGADRTYTPDPDYNGPDTFTYRADDGTAHSVAAVSLTVAERNDPPTAAADSKGTAEDVELRFPAAELVSNDVAGPPNEAAQALAVTAVGSPVGGTVALDSGDVVFTPAADFNGAAGFSYTVADDGQTNGSADPRSAVGSVSVAVAPVNDAPVAQGGSAAVEEDADGLVTLTASDVDGDPVTFTIVAAPAHGELAGTGADRTYTPDPDYNGQDSFTYTANDGTADSDVATVTLSVSEVNDAPTTLPDETSTDEDTVLQFAADTLVANDAAGPADEAAQGLTVTAVESLVGGTVELNAGDVTFTPATNFNGAASFSYTVADDGQTGAAADPKTGVGTVNVVIAPVNDPPVADVVAAAVNEDEGGAITLSATDVDGDPLTYNVLVHPSNGSVNQPVGDQVTYTPVANYAGPDSFAFIASDGSSDSELGLVSVDVTSINDAPVLDASGSPQLTPVNANANNPAGDTVAEILASGAGGDPVNDVDSDNVGIAVTTVDEANGAWEYMPAGGTWSALAGADAASARLLAVDSRVRFVPAPGFSGDVTFQFRAWDRTTGSAGGTADATTGGGSSAFSAEVEIASITVIANSLPAAVDDTKTTDEDTPVVVDVLANDSDVDGDVLTVSDVTQPTEGTATIEDGVVRYAPDTDANGTDQFTYTVSDGQGGTATAKVSMTVAAVNDVPIARDDNAFVAEDGSVVVDPRENDLAGPREENAGPLSAPTITGAPSPAEGAASVISTGLNAGKIRFTPATGFTGSTGVLYEVCDDGTPALCSEAAVSVTVARVTATVETRAVPHGGLASQDAADDAAIWVDPNDPSRSVVIGTNKYSDATTNGGLAVYDLSGNELQYTNEGRINNVDLRSGFTLAGSQATLVTASQRTDGTVSPPRPKRIAVYTLDPSTRTLTRIHSFTPTFEPLGACMYRSATTGNFFVFVVAANGWVEQWQLSESPSGSGQIEAANARTFRVSATGSGDIAEGCVADDGLGHLYISEEDVALWKYSAEPDGGESRTQVDAAGGGQLTADIEGLAIAYGPGDTGFLIASSQGSNSYSVYRREGGNAFVRSFKVKDGAVDGTSVTDGIDVTSASLGPAFPNGAFVAQDNNNAPDNQNFKLVPLEQIVQTAGLGSNGSCARPYTDSSPWNTPISAGAVVHADSGMHVAALGGPLTSNPAQFTFPVYLVDASTPRETVTLTGWYSNVTNGGRTLVNQREGTVQLPIPAGAAPAAGSDAQMIMIDRLTGEEWGFSRAARDPVTGAWTGWNAYHYSTRWTGVPPYDATGRPFVPRGAGLPYLAGLVRPCELARGRIDHAIAFAYDFPTKQFVYPATKSDGDGPGSPDVPEGSRLQLDPALTAADLAALGCAGHCLTIARALQVYGMYVIDNSRRPKIMVEYEGTAAWGGAVTATTVSPIPMSSFRLLSPS